MTAKGALPEALEAHVAGRLDDARAAYEAILAAEPEHAEALRLWGTVALQQGRIDDAILALKTALERDPSVAEGWEHLGLAQWQAGHLEAATSLRTATQRDPERASAWSNLARVLVDQGQLGEAVAAATIATDRAPAWVDTWVNLGLAKKELGDLAAAEQAYRRAIAVDPSAVVAYAGLSELRLVDDPADPALTGLRQRVDAGAIRSEDEELAGFALGRLCEDAGDFDVSWAAFTAANRARARRVGAFDPEALHARYARLREWRRRDLVSGGSEDARPVFVVGFPRSGTTLVEGQIAAHPEAVGLGEDTALHGLASPWEADPGFPAQRPGSDWLSQAAASWLARLPPDARRVTTKLPHDFEHLWLAALLFPRAQVVWVRRDARDVAVSCFTQPWATGHPYKQDLASVFQAIYASNDLMNHWQAELPLPVHVVEYERFVADPVRERAALLGALGLDAASGEAPYQRTLDAYRRGTGIRTDAVGRWRRYEQHVTRATRT